MHAMLPPQKPSGGKETESVATPAHPPTHATAPATYHVPVMVEEVLRLLLSAGPGVFLDGTLGGGGHALALLEACPDCRLIGVDQDPEALAASRARLSSMLARVEMVEARFDEAARIVRERGVSLAGALLDLGISSRQIDAVTRGFTHRDEAPLDMRMASQGMTAAQFLNEASEEALTHVFRIFGELPRARPLARAIVQRRGTHPFATAGDLNAVLATQTRGPLLAKDKAPVYQALRIQVNSELEALAEALPRLRDALRPGGVLVVLSYHSLEDRMVKRAFVEWSEACHCPPRLPVCACGGVALGERLTRKALRPSEAEVQENPRARSVRLRAWRKAA
jgi:16S rRNA (cytosine1402-N4)-methyltransferase